MKRHAVALLLFAAAACLGLFVGRGAGELPTPIGALPVHRTAAPAHAADFVCTPVQRPPVPARATTREIA